MFDIADRRAPGAAVASRIANAFLRQVVEVGLFHADPHAGNLLLTPPASVGLIDFGMVGQVDDELRGHMVVALVAALLGVWFISGGLQGYVTFCGPLGKSVLGYVMRTMLVFAGLAMAIPGNESLGLTHLGTAITGVVLAAPPILVALMQGRRAATA